jgi:hypothetical protein
MATISGYEIKGYDIKFYCKVTEMNIGSPTYKCVLSFGTGMKQFCMTAMYDKQKNPNTIYIDRVENNDLCVKDGLLSNYDKGTIKFVKTSLCAMKQLFPQVVRFTFTDDSQIYCDKKSKLFKLSMSYDYILKYNESWYQKNFDAILPGFISKYYDNNKHVVITSEPGSIMDTYVKSLQVLDEPIMEYLLIKDTLPQLNKYKKEYEASKTPREFIQTLRVNLGNTFCFVVGPWLNQYMMLLQVKLSPEYWYITTIESDPNFKMIPMDPEDAIKMLDNPTRFQSGGGTRKRNKRNKRLIYKMIADSNFTEHCVGYYHD